MEKDMSNTAYKEGWEACAKFMGNKTMQNTAYNYYISLYYGKWAIVHRVDADEPQLEVKSPEHIIELFDSRNEADRFLQGVTFAMREMNAL
jgi:hypothetical protein